MATGSVKLHPVASRLLVAGVAVSFVFLIAGLAGEAAGGTIAAKLDWRQLAAASDGQMPSLLLHLGILALIATPVATVAALMVEFVKSRESLFALLCLGILLLLVVGLVTGVN
ncbi:MAG: DUF1634 domain-containing protein [Acidobacteria bacterium]|nr:DUF1634 domain-containing protein [Acidobacteriota bacterium]